MFSEKLHDRYLTRQVSKYACENVVNFHYSNQNLFLGNCSVLLTQNNVTCVTS